MYSCWHVSNSKAGSLTLFVSSTSLSLNAHRGLEPHCQRGCTGETQENPGNPVPQLELVVSFPLMLGHLNGKMLKHTSTGNSWGWRSWRSQLHIELCSTWQCHKKIWPNPSECRMLYSTENRIDIAIESPCTIFGSRCPNDLYHLSSRRVSRYRPSKAWEIFGWRLSPVLSCELLKRRPPNESVCLGLDGDGWCGALVQRYSIWW